MKTIIANTNDLLALLVLIVIPVLWVLQGRGIINMPGEVIGATIMGWTLVLQYYFRKKQGENGTGTPPA